MTRPGEIVCFGELLLRLNAPGAERLLQTHALVVHPGGAEANVAAALAQMGVAAAMASVVPDNALGAAAVQTLRALGVDTGACVTAPGRMGLYFMTAGAVLRPSEILYDRQNSAFALAEPDLFDWDHVLAGADWLHVSGITPAVSAKASAAALGAVKAATARGVKVSFDGNYRANLWAQWSGDGPATIAALLSHATHAFIDYRDAGLIFGKTYDGTPEDRRKAAHADLFAAFESLQTIAATTREQSSVVDHQLSAAITSRTDIFETDTATLPSVVDRIGGGDAFAAGVLAGFIEGASLKDALDLGFAAAVLKHSIPGDMLIGTRADIDAQRAAGGLDVKR